MFGWDSSLFTALIVTILAGLSTAIGGGLSLIAKKTNTSFFSAALGLSAGVMIYVSFLELLPTALTDFNKYTNPKNAYGLLILALFGGIMLIALIDALIPTAENPHEPIAVEELNTQKAVPQLGKVGMLMALSIGIHNFPEGMATFTTMLTNPDIGWPIAGAVAIHNIPEGIAVAVPIYHATGSKQKAFWFSFLSGLAEPIGALIGFAFLLPFWSAIVNGIVLGATAGIMIYISLDELLPTAKKYGKHHFAIGGLVGGMLIMALSLYLMM